MLLAGVVTWPDMYDGTGSGLDLGPGGHRRIRLQSGAARMDIRSPLHHLVVTLFGLINVIVNRPTYINCCCALIRVSLVSCLVFNQFYLFVNGILIVAH